MNTRVIPLTVTSRYARSWGTWEGVRELVQNWHDGLHSMAAMLDNLPLDTNVKVEFRGTKDKSQQSFEAFIRNPENREEIVLGKLTYNWLQSKLILTNQCTALKKKILLLGYSVKADTKEVIGQFGEGLKIGALALVRQGHMVTMETGSDVWEFQLLHNEEFGEKVLTVVVSERLPEPEEGYDPETESSEVPSKTGDNNSTCTKICGVEWEDWKKFLPRFLFLKPPDKYVKTELGTLLLDKHLAGQLFMKGIWVSDLQDEDLATGVDFLHLHIDRDRNAVPKPSEIDHQVSGMWIRALDKDPNLTKEYFHLLLNDKFRDVRHAADYATPEMAILIADQFLSEYGSEAFPVLNKTTAADIQAVRNELNRTAILCTDTLINLLVKSGRFDPLSKALATHRKTESVLVPYSSLTSEQRLVLQEGIALVNTADPHFNLGMVDVIDTPTREMCTVKESQVNVPVWMMNLEAVHQELNMKHREGHTHCKCRESVMCGGILDTRKELLKPAKVNMVNMDADQGPSFTFHPLMSVTSLLASQVCEKAREAYCAEVHQRDNSPTDEGVLTDFKLKEEAYLKKIDSLESEMKESNAESIETLTHMERKLMTVEKQLLQKEVDLLNEEALIQSRFQQQITAIRASAQESVRSLQHEVKCGEEKQMNLQQQLLHKDKNITQLRTELEEVTAALEKKNSLLLEELSHYITQNRKRTASVYRLSKEGQESEGGDQDTRGKWTLISSICDMVLEDLQSEKFVCAVCKIKRKSRLLQPCGHYVLCEDCATSSVRTNLCPVCKQPARSHIQVFE